MATKTLPPRRAGAIVQFSVFTPNRLGRLYDMIGLLASGEVHVLALSVFDATECAVVRLIVDDPDRARSLLTEQGFPFAESTVLGVELDAAASLPKLMAALLEAELNVNFVYPFIPHPLGRSILAVSMEDDEMAEQVLRSHQFHVLKQSDISR